LASVAGPLRGHDPVERFLNRLESFEPLSPAARNVVRRAVQRGPLVSAEKEMHVEALPDVTIVLNGWICHFRLLDNGRRQITSIMLPGDFVDFGFLVGRPAQTQFLASAPSQLGRIRPRHFTELAEEFPEIMRAALQAASTEAAISRERLISLGLRSAIERVSHLFCELFYRLDAVGLVAGDNCYDLPMTQADLGAALGLSTVHVNRTVQVLRKRGIITMQNGRLWIEDLRELAGLAGFDPAYLSSVRPAGTDAFS